MTDLLTIANDTLRVAINPFGAELTSITDAQGREWMTDADPAFWTGHAPLLFPIVGRLNGDVLHVDGVGYPMKQHGVARRQMFAVVAHEASQVVLRLTDTDETRAAYPFGFVLEMTYTLDGATLTMAARIANPGDGALPASFGWHPAFAWPLPGGGAREAHAITFAADEPGMLRQIAADGTILPTPRPSPLAGRTLALHDALFAADALIWDPVESPAVTYGVPGGPRLEIAFPDTPRLGIWTKPGAHFVCVEPWHGIADPQGFTGDIREKPGVFAIAPGDDWRCAMQVTVHP